MGAEVILKLHSFGSLEDATKVADDIRQAGEIKYATTEGGDVTVTVGDVTVENA